MRVERTPVEPTPAVAEAARQQIMDALVVIYPGWTFTGGVVLATAGEHVALVSVGDAYNDVVATAGALIFGGQLGQSMIAGGA